MAHRVFGANSGFRVELCAAGKVSVSQEFSASVGKAFILGGGDWALGYHSMVWFRHFSDFP